MENKQHDAIFTWYYFSFSNYMPLFGGGRPLFIGPKLTHLHDFFTPIKSHIILVYPISQVHFTIAAKSNLASLRLLDHTSNGFSITPLDDFLGSNHY